MSPRSSFVPRFAVALLALLIPLAAHAALPELDRSLAPGPDARVAASLNRLRTDPALLRIGNVAHVDERYGVPTFVWAAPTPARQTAAVPVARAAAARGFLGTVAPLYGLDARDVREAPLRYVHDTGRGGVIATFTQRVNGVDVFRDELKVLMDRSGRLLAATGSIPSQTALGRAPLTFRMRANDAVGKALDDFAGRTMLRNLNARGAVDGYETFAPGATLAIAAGLTPDRTIRAKQVYFHQGATLVPGWYVELMGEQQAYSYVIADADGSVLFRHSLIANDNYRVWAATGSPFLPHDGPQGTSPTPHPTGNPDFYTPPFTAPSLVGLQNSPFSNNDPWLPPGATVTTGNNVDAYADLASPDGFSGGDFRASTTSAATFDRTYDTALAPNSSTAQQMASITQLFYDNNFFHDWYYDSGFDEASGNGQTNNFGRGGLGGDPVRAEAQDYSGTNNANMATPSDGGSPRMQMYVFTVTVNNLTVNAPAAIAGSKDIGTATFGPQSFTLTGNVVLAVDGTAPVNDGCSAISGTVSGKIALIDRGTCGFINKVQNAQAAGAIGVLIANNVANTAPPAMGGAGAVSIPSLSITKELGDSIKTQLGLGTVNVTLQRGPETSRDGTIDQQIVAHEWGHYISNRLIGDANGLSNQQGGGMGEGWGDFHAMLLTVRAEDASVPSNANYNGVYGMAAYATGSSHNNSYYYGIRRVPYSTDMTKNGFTFHHITNGIPLPSVPTAFGQDGANNAEVHNIGEVWCTMLWECYAALLRDTGRLTFTQAQSRMKDYLVAAYKLTPNAPTMVEARDAVLAAAYANDPADYSAFWTAFAKRGMGVGAVAPDRNSSDGSGVIESFVVGGDVAFVSGTVTDDVGSCDHDGYLDEGETGTLTITLRNSGAVTLNSTTATVTSPTTGVTFPSGNTINFPSSAVFTNTVASIPVKLTGAGPGPIALTFQVSYGDPAQVTPNPQNATVSAYGRVNETPSATETMEEQLPGFTFASNPSFADAPFSRLEVSGTDHKLFGPDPGSQADTWAVSPALNVAATGNFTFTFSHSFSFEQDATNAYDGGMIELSNNGGASWVDIGASASPGYNGTLFVGSNNPLGGRNAFVRTSPSYPSSNVVTVNLGTTYAGQTVQIRFRIGCDEAAGGAGWQIDDIAFANITNQPFQSIVADPNVCAPTGVGDESLPTELAFAIAGATPSRGDVGLRFALPTATHVDIAVFDVTGRKVATLANGPYEPGRYSTTWKRGGAGGSGVYFARMIAGGRTLTQRVLVLR